MRNLLPEARSAVRLAGVVVASLLLLAAVLAAAGRVLVAATDGVLGGVTVLGRDVGGLERSALASAVEGIADEYRAQRVAVAAGGREASAPRRTVGSSLDVDATVEAAWEQGRRGVWRPLLDHVAAWRGEEQEVARLELDEQAMRRWAAGTAGRLSTPPRPPRIGFAVGDDRGEVEVEVTEPREGEVVDPEGAIDRLRAELATPGPVEVEAPTRTVAPDIDERDVEPAVREARRAISAPVLLENPTRGEGLRLAPEDLAAVLQVREDREADPGDRLRLHLDPSDLREHLEDRIEEAEVSPTDARFAIVEGEVRIRGGRAGFDVSVEDAAERIVDLAGEEAPREGELPGERREPEFSRSDAEELGIQEPVSSFATEYSCCPPRVQNIHRIANLVDGALIPPGQRFELNDHVGPRTRERGFVAAPAIVGGEFVDVVGGGVSQFATTFFNAAFFAGIELEEFQPHSYYFERYPMGNEATISWRSIDLAVVNDSPYGILVETSHTDTSVTVTFWSTEWADVEIERIGPTNVVEGATRDGFDVTVRRLIEYPDGSTEVEEYFHRYRPED